MTKDEIVQAAMSAMFDHSITAEEAIETAIDKATEELRKRLDKDRELLEWAEKNGELKHIYEEGRPETTLPVLHLPKMNFDFEDLTLRQAITIAMKAEANEPATETPGSPPV